MAWQIDGEDATSGGNIAVKDRLENAATRGIPMDA